MVTSYSQRVAMKTAQLRIRVEEELHDSFMDSCREIDRPASQVIREFMKRFIEEQDLARQRDLFVTRQATLSAASR